MGGGVVGWGGMGGKLLRTKVRKGLPGGLPPLVPVYLNSGDPDKESIHYWCSLLVTHPRYPDFMKRTDWVGQNANSPKTN